MQHVTVLSAYMGMGVIGLSYNIILLDHNGLRMWVDESDMTLSVAD